MKGRHQQCKTHCCFLVRLCGAEGTREVSSPRQSKEFQDRGKNLNRDYLPAVFNFSGQEGQVMMRKRNCTFREEGTF